MEHSIVMISSTALDLPDHRRGVLDACERLGMMPKMMEHLPAMDADAIEASLAMVHEADIYVGIFAHRYGYVPKGCSNSITQREYERARKRRIPRLIFLIHEDHPVKKADIEMGPGAERLEKLKDRLLKERVVEFFKSPEELKGQVIHALGEEKAKRLEAEKASGAEAARGLHPSVDIPALPEPYIAHQFSLLRTRTGLVGRSGELNLLTDWIVRPETIGHARVFTMVAIGGQGKSALSWHWFNHVAPNELTGARAVEGRVWWSFYESDATYENFLIRTLAYVTGRPVDEVRKMALSECEPQLLQALDQRPFLLVLDGLERILVAYAGMGAPFVQDEEATQAEQQSRLRQTIDPRAGRFLCRLAAVRASRVLMTTRLFPAVLEGPTDEPVHAVCRFDLPGLSADDALALWRSFEVSGSREELLPLFGRFENHPLLVQALAAEVAHDRDNPRDFDAWRAANPGFDPFSLPLTQVKSHILKVAMSGLSEQENYVLHVMAAFRMPAGWDTLSALSVGDEPRQYADQGQLIAGLADLEDRGLLGWDNRPGVNRYDLHPIVRGVTWGNVREVDQQAIYGTLQVHFEAMPMVALDDVNSLEELTPAIELYDKLAGLKRYDDACCLLEQRLQVPLRKRLAANQVYLKLALLLFPDGLDQPPTIDTDPRCLFEQISWAYAELGDLKRGLLFHMRHSELCSVITCALKESQMLEYLGRIYESELSAVQVFKSIRRNRRHRSSRLAAVAHIARANFLRGNEGIWERIICEIDCRHRQAKLDREANSEWFIELLLDHAEHIGDVVRATQLAEELWNRACRSGDKAWMIEAGVGRGRAALLASQYDEAHDQLTSALAEARSANLILSEMLTLVPLATLQWRRGEPEAACEVLEDVWEPAERGPFPMFHADGLNVLVSIERDADNRDAAVAAAEKAFRLAWCDGPPFAYHWGLEAARKHLGELGAAEPKLPPFDESKFEPMPEVEIDPGDDVGE